MVCIAEGLRPTASAKLSDALLLFQDRDPETVSYLSCMHPTHVFALLALVCTSLFVQAQDGGTAIDTILDIDSVAVKPEFPGGDAAMYAWLRDNTIYPDSALDKGAQGKVFVEFVVEKNGKLDQVKLRRGCDPWLDQEALRVVEHMPKWTPGKLEDGEEVAVRYTLPFSFKLR